VRYRLRRAAIRHDAQAGAPGGAPWSCRKEGASLNRLRVGESGHYRRRGAGLLSDPGGRAKAWDNNRVGIPTPTGQANVGTTDDDGPASLASTQR